ncbi:MAG: ADOP family duplicated permease [Gemmatimonadales bacterium]
MDTLLQDLRYALRQLRARPGFTAAAVFTLALGIGAATAGFSLLNWLLLRPVPGVRDGSSLADVWFGVHYAGGGVQPRFVSYEQHAAILRGVPALSGLAGRQRSSVSLGGEDALPRRVEVEFVMASYFDVLGVRPQLGRALAPDDDALPDGAQVAVIGDRLWRDWFGGRPDVLGQTLRINALAFTVIGVAPRGFHGTERLGDTDLWLPGRTQFDVRHIPAAARFLGTGSPGYYEFVARLRPGSDFTQADAQLRLAILRAARLSAEWTEKFEDVTAKLYPGIGLFALGRASVVRPLWLVMGIVGLVLVIACANVANLLLLRGAGRRGETAVRVALGASPARLARLHLAESLVLSALGAAAGMVLAFWLNGLFEGTQLQRAEIRHVALDWRVAAFAVGAALAAAGLVALAPALSAGRTDVSATLKGSAATQVARAPLRGGLAVLQLSASLTLVVGALLLGRTLAGLAQVELGFEPTGVVAFTVQPRDVGYDSARTRAYYRELLARVAALPGVEHATLAEDVPFVCCSHVLPVGLAGSEAHSRVEVYSNAVGPGYFRALGIPLLLGQDFTRADVLPESAAALLPTVLSLGLARRLFGTADPVGKLVELPQYRAPSLRMQVIGVAGDSRWNDLEREVPLFMYVPLGYQGRADAAALLVRSGLRTSDVTAAVAREARSLDANLPLSEPRPILTGIARQLSTRRLLLKLLGVLAGLTVVLAGVGVYGLVSYGVTLRTREFGIRMALGAERRRILATAMRGGLRLAAFGVALGIAGAVALTRLVRAWLFGVTPLDPTSLVIAAAVLAFAALFASWLPARRATKVDPMVALRAE